VIPGVVPQPLPAIVAYELLLQSYLFFGYPQAIEVMRVFARVRQELGIAAPDADDQPTLAEMRSRGEIRCREIYHPNFEQLQENMKTISAELADWMLIEGYGKVLSRSGPSKLEREIASIIFLACSHHPVQLFSHVRGARNLGITKDELLQVVTQADLESDKLKLVTDTIRDVFTR
jgi:alkylhydroperoxidase/carboxymuconolactone decarboxylase family protein YurZ